MILVLISFLLEMDS